MAISKINVGGTSHDLKDGLLHTVHDKPNYLLNNLLSAPDSSEPLTRFTADQMQHIKNREYTKALPVGARIKLPAVNFTDEGVTYNENVKEWVYCGNADEWGSMIFMMADETIYNIESDLAKAKYNCEDVGPNDTSIFSSKTVLSVLTSSAVGLSKVIKKQFEDFVSEHSGVSTYIAPQECWYPLGKAQSRALLPGNNISVQQQGQQAWTSMEGQPVYTDLGETYEILFDCATSFNIFGTIAFPNLLLPVVLPSNNQATKINYGEAEIYAYGGKSPLKKFQFPIFQGQQAGEVLQQNFPSSVILDERRYAPRKSGNYFPFGIEYPTYIGGGLLGLTTKNDVNEKNLERMLPYVVVSFD